MGAETRKYVVRNIQKNLDKKSKFNFGEMAERFKAVDCKSIEFSHRRFESYFLLFSFSKYGVVGSAPVLGTGGHVSKSHYFEFVTFLFVNT